MEALAISTITQCKAKGTELADFSFSTISEYHICSSKYNLIGFSGDIKYVFLNEYLNAFYQQLIKKTTA